MICVSVMDSDKGRVIEAIEGHELAEVRLEALSPTPEDVREIFSSPAKLIATMRPGKHSDEERLKTLTAAIEAGAAYVDIELGSPTLLREGLAQAARRNGCEIIVSHHDFQSTPDRDELMEIVDRCFEEGADLAKIACVVKERADAARLLGLLEDPRPIVAIGMGRMGAITRVAAPLLGSPFTYASPEGGPPTAEGQLPEGTLRRIMEEIANGAG